MKKINVLDTNVFLSDPKALFAFPGEVLVIPISVIEEIDEFKKGLNELGRNAREVLRKIDKLRKRGHISSENSLPSKKGKKAAVNLDRVGIELNNKGRLIIELNHTDHVPAGLSKDKVDNRILAVAIYYRQKFPKAETRLITKDANVRIKADALGIISLDFESKNQVAPDAAYHGFHKLEVSTEVINGFLSKKKIPNTFPELKLCPNEFIIFIDKNNPNNNATGRYIETKTETHTESKTEKIIELLGTTPSPQGLEAHNPEQLMALNLLLDDRLPLVTITGKAGTGKTLLAVAAGLTKTADDGVYSRLLVSRPVFPMGKDIGYLPGTLEEKLNPWMQPIFDNLEFIFTLGKKDKRDVSKTRTSKMVEEMKNQGILQIEPLTYIRGRSIPKQFMIVDEAQNLTLHEIKTIITRAGKDTKIVLTGDPEQIDNPYVDSQSNGLTQLIEKMKDSTLSGHITLLKGERSELAEEASQKLN